MSHEMDIFFLRLWLNEYIYYLRRQEAEFKKQNKKENKNKNTTVAWS